MIEQRTLEQLRESVSLYDVISRHVELKRQGGSWFGLCPFHSESSPSFTVPASGDKPFFHCFGCGAHGDAIEFLQRHTGQSFADAVRDLASQAGVAVQEGQRSKPALKAAAKFAPLPAAKEGHQLLDENAAHRLTTWQSRLPGSPGESYLAGRGIPLEVAQQVGAGYLPPGEAMGVNAEGKPMAYGPRIVLPHTLPGGDLVNLYGRSIEPDAGKETRHRHLPPPKGLFNAAALAQDGPLWVVEGPFDALALKAAGVHKVVAIFGLAGFDWRWFKGQREIVLALDCDDSGRAAANKLADDAAYRAMKVRRLDASAYGGCKDVSEAWQQGRLQLDGYLAERQQLVEVPPIGDPPERMYVREWADFKATAAWFTTFHLKAAMAAGWTLPELFSIPTNRAGLDAGVIWTLTGFKMDGIEADGQVLTGITREGSRMAIRKADLKASGVLPWAAAEPA